MKSSLLLVLIFLGSVAVAAEDEAALKDQMKLDCAPLFVAGGICADLAKGTRNCTRQNKEKGGEKCASFEKAHKEFFDAGKDDPIIRK
jgi:hypothetical protein